MVIPRAPGVSALGGAAVYAVGTEGRQETASGERAPRCQLGAGSPEGGEWDIECSSLCYSIEPCYLYVLHIVLYFC